MQVQGKDAATYVKYSGPLDCAIKTMENEGVSLFFAFLILSVVLCFCMLRDHYFLRLEVYFVVA